MQFSKQELSLFFDRLEQLFDAEQIVLGVKKPNGERHDVTVQLHLGMRPRDGKHAILMDIEILEDKNHE